MAVSSRYVQVHPDALVEWIWDDSFFYADNYSVVRDMLNNVTSFAFSKNANDAANRNKIPQQLYLIDGLINKYGVADPDVKAFLQESKYANNQPSHFNKVKVWFPIHYTFPNTTGFFVGISALDYENAVPYDLANYFLDISVPGELSKVVNETQPFRLNERLWGKSLTIYVPSVYDESRLRVNNAPQLGSVNYNLTSGVLGLSQTSPITIDFRFLSAKAIVLGDTTYFTTPPLVQTLPQAPEYNTLGVSIKPATDGDYFLINGTYNGTVGEFDTFMTALSQSGQQSYVIYTVTPVEENIPQDAVDYYVYQDFLGSISHRPIFKFSNTTAAIQVDLKLISAVDSSVITRSTTLTLVGNDVAKYGKYLTAINIAGAISPKIYNSKPDSIALPPMELLNSHLRRKANANANNTPVHIPYPVLTNTYNIVAQDATLNTNSGIYYGFGDLQLTLNPFDNVMKIKVAQQVTADSSAPFVFPSSNSIIQLVFKSATAELRVPLYIESNEVNLAQGVLVFRVASSDHAQLATISQTNSAFYITITTNGMETVVYDGVYSLLDVVPRTSAGIQLAPATPKITLPKLTLNKEVPSLPGKLTPTPVTTTGTMLSQILNNSLSTQQFKRLQ